MDPKKFPQDSDLSLLPLFPLLVYSLLFVADAYLPDTSPWHPFLEYAYPPIALSVLLYALLRLLPPQPAARQNQRTALLTAVHRTMPAATDWHWEEMPFLAHLPGEESFLELRNAGTTFPSAFLVAYDTREYGTNIVILPQGTAPGQSCFLRMPVPPEQLMDVRVACLVDGTSTAFRFSSLHMPERGPGFFGICAATQDLVFLDAECLHCRICPNG